MIEVSKFLSQVWNGNQQLWSHSFLTFRLCLLCTSCDIVSRRGRWTVRRYRRGRSSRWRKVFPNRSPSRGSNRSLLWLQGKVAWASPPPQVQHEPPAQRLFKYLYASRGNPSKALEICDKYFGVNSFQVGVIFKCWLAKVFLKQRVEIHLNPPVAFKFLVRGV